MMVQSNRPVVLGVDIGSVATKLVVLDDGGELVRKVYRRHHGQSIETLIAILKEVMREVDPSAVAGIALTGAGTRRLADTFGLVHYNEVISQVEAIGHTHPEVHTVIEVGGEDSKLIKLRRRTEADAAPVLEDFTMNAVCAAGTGSFLDQQASRLGIDIDGQFGELALKSKEPPRVAGRCSVFAKSDMIHLQQQATPDYDIVAGLCFAMARNFRGQLAQGVEIVPPVAFQGGVASNAGVVRAFREVLGLAGDAMVIPEHYNVMGALGAALRMLDQGVESPFPGVEQLEAFAGESRRDGDASRLEPLAFFPGEASRHYVLGETADPSTVKDEVVGFLGVDVGSVSTNVVVIDEKGRLVAKSYLPTAGRPLEAVRQGLKETADLIGKPIRILGAGTTGSGRYLTGDFIGADIVVNEITAQATGAASLDPAVDTIFEIGGQDSKYISLKNGVVVDFEMNHVCAAGTGSFLEEQAEKLGISIKGEFAELALASASPVRLGERCTVFMESDLLHHQQRGHKTPELVAGLAYSIVYNYLNRVVGRHRIGENIFFQGGTAANRAVVAAFEKVVGRPITVPRHHDVTGALGMALLARDNYEKTDRPETNFRGFDLSQATYELESFTCTHCPNECEIKKVTLEGQAPMFYGARCDRYEMKKEVADDGTMPDLFGDRERFLLERYKTYAGGDRGGNGHKPVKVGLPWGLFYHELLPFWATLVGELGGVPVLSGRSTKKVIRAGVESVLAETCFPVKVMHGHVARLREMNVDTVLLPSIINMVKNHNAELKDHLCPYVQTVPYQVQAAFDWDHTDVKLLRPIVSFHGSRKQVARALKDTAAAIGCASMSRIRRAVDKAFEAQETFWGKCRARGREVMANLENYPAPTVIISRPYNGPDFGMNLELPKKLKDLGVTAIPLDFLPLDESAAVEDWPNMYWKYGQRILAGARLVCNTVGLGAVYITNFGCGPDSFLVTFVKNMLGSKPSLVLEIDEHSADAGVITRCEAFLDSRRNRGETERIKPKAVPEFKKIRDRVLYVPRMCDHAFPLAAAFEACGVKAEVLPESDDRSLELGRRYTTGKECLPAIVTAGDMLRKLEEPDCDPARAAFFMPSGDGPCRFGQYNTLHRIILKEYGHPEVPVISPNQGRNFYDDFASIEGDPTHLAWKGIVAVDILRKALLHVRPYEVEPGTTDRVYRRGLDAVCGAIRAKGDIRKAMQRTAAEFDAVEQDRSVVKPLVGIIGEIYVRSHPYSNQNVIRKLERLGCEVDLAAFGEWIFYINFTRARANRTKGEYLQLFKNSLIDRVQRRDERQLAAPFARMLHNAVEPPTREVLDRADRYVHNSFEGEACLSLGKAVEFYEQGAAGVVNLMPFTCMPGTIVSSVLKRLRRECDSIPILSLAFDGSTHASTDLRLEAFVYQVQQFHDRTAAGAGHPV